MKNLVWNLFEACLEHSTFKTENWLSFDVVYEAILEIEGIHINKHEFSID